MPARRAQMSRNEVKDVSEVDLMIDWKILRSLPACGGSGISTEILAVDGTGLRLGRSRSCFRFGRCIANEVKRNLGRPTN